MLYWDKCDVVVEGECDIAGQEHIYLETQRARAIPIEKNGLRVFSSTQSPYAVQSSIANILRLAHHKIEVHVQRLGGGFGGKTRNRQAVEAARLAKSTGKPVQVAWSREEEFYYDTFQPAAMVTIKSGLNSRNQITYWDYAVYFAGDRESHVVL